MPLNVVEYKSRKILIVNYTSCKSEDELISLLHKVFEFVENNPSRTLIVSDFTNVFSGIKFMNEAKRLKKGIPNNRLPKSAVTGITAVQQILLKGYNMISFEKTQYFKTKEEAFEYLVS